MPPFGAIDAGIPVGGVAELPVAPKGAAITLEGKTGCGATIGGAATTIGAEGPAAGKPAGTEGGMGAATGIAEVGGGLGGAAWAEVDDGAVVDGGAVRTAAPAPPSPAVAVESTAPGFFFGRPLGRFWGGSSIVVRRCWRGNRVSKDRRIEVGQRFQISVARLSEIIQILPDP